MQDYLQRAWAWFQGLSGLAKAGIVIGITILIVLAISISPLLILVAMIAAVVYGIKALRQHRSEDEEADARTPGMKALVSVGAMLLFIAFTTVFHGGETEEVADREPVPSQESTEEPQQEQANEDEANDENAGDENAGDENAGDENAEQEREGAAEEAQEQERQSGEEGASGDQSEQDDQPEEQQAQGSQSQESQEGEEEQGLFEGLLDEPEEESGPIEEPEQMVLSGTGDTVTDPVQVEEGLGVMNMSHQGQSNFVVEEVNGGIDEMNSLLVNKIGNYSGANAANLQGGEMAFDVDADGPWEIVVNQPRAREGADQRSFEGNTDAVSGLIELESGNITVDMEHQGQGNFIVELLDENGAQAGWDSLVANEIGPYTGSSSVEIPEDGTYILDIEADGPWAISLN